MPEAGEMRLVGPHTDGVRSMSRRRPVSVFLFLPRTQMRKGVDKMKRKGFTLIELLVVIAIIALLLSIILPSLNKVKDIAAMKICGNNARQIMLAGTMYSNDNKELVPRSRTRYLTEGDPINNYSWTCLPVINPSVTPKTAADFITSFPMKATMSQRQAGIRHGTLFPYLGNTDVYNCSRDTRVRKADGGYRSYSLNETVFNGVGDVTGKWGPSAKKTSEVKNPGGRMAVIEQGDARGYNYDGLVFSSHGPTDWEEPLAYWHKGGFMYACFDGHVEHYVIKVTGTRMYNDIFISDPTASIYYANHPSLAAYPANQNKDFYNITQLLDNFGYTSRVLRWVWAVK